MECIMGNVLVTAGGIYSHRMLQDAIATVGADRVLFASDDPFGGEPQIEGSRTFLTSAPITDEDKVKIARGNALRCILDERMQLPSGTPGPTCYTGDK